MNLACFKPEGKIKKAMNLACFWSGGKDSNLALYKAQKEGHNIIGNVTFTFDAQRFRAHPQSLLPLQAKALGINYFHFNANKPYLGDYRKAIRSLIRDYNIEALVTGDLWLQCSIEWMKKVCKPLKVRLLTPLWKIPPSVLLNELTSKNFKPIITCIKKPLLPESWLGKAITKSSLKKLKADCKKSKADFCGENGEYHSIVLDAPNYKKKIELSKFSIGKKNEYRFLKPLKYRLIDKT